MSRASPATASGPTRRGARPALALAALCVLFVALAAVDLDDVRPVSGDDAIIVSVSARLAEQGVLASPLHEGFAGAGHHYFLNLPLQHVLQAGTFLFLGTGVTQARLVSLAAAVALLVASTMLAARWFGSRVAAATALLLVFWRCGLVGIDYGLPLLAVARSARYDITAVAFLWLAILVFDSLLRRPARGSAIATGVLAAAAMLTQFHGVLVIPALAALWLTRSDRKATGVPHGAWIGMGLLLGLAPYAAYFAVHAGDALTQIRIAHAARIVDGPTGLLGTIATEPVRFSAAVWQRGIGQIGLLLALAGSLILVRQKAAGDAEIPKLRDGTRRLLALLVALLGPLALLESTKAPIYALPLLPAFCMMLAAVLDAVWRYASGRTRRTRVALRGVTLLTVAALGGEGAAALVKDRIAARRISSYEDVAATLERALAAGAPVAGPAQWAWALRTHPYVEIGAVALRQRAAGARGGRIIGVEEMLRERGVRYVVVNDDLRGELRRERYGPAFTRALSSVLDRCTRSLRSFTDATYGPIAVHILLPDCPPEPGIGRNPSPSP